ncbi:MAG: hypothetical protein MJ108_00230 [Saccharofermentans sp.]|nr:hypothetical protein [Saccharofermentans sp.]
MKMYITKGQLKKDLDAGKITQEEYSQIRNNMNKSTVIVSVLICIIVFAGIFNYYIHSTPIKYVNNNVERAAEDAFDRLADEDEYQDYTEYQTLIMTEFFNNSDIDDVSFDKENMEITVRFKGPDLGDFYSVLYDEATDAGVADVAKYVLGVSDLRRDVIDECSTKKYKVIVSLNQGVFAKGWSSESSIREYVEEKIYNEVFNYITEEIVDAGLGTKAN